ncbi:MAG: hypothetical protein AABY43_03335 [Candidatus Omnitrophota bacterium]
MNTKIKLAVLTTAFLFSAGNTFAFEIHNSELNFKVSIPDSFREYDPLKAQRDERTKNYLKSILLYAYNKGGEPENNQYTGIFLNIERSIKVMAGQEASEYISASEEILREKWKNRQVNVFRKYQTYTTKGDVMVTLTAVVNLSPEPIQFKLSGDKKDEKEMYAILKSMLANLEGKAAYPKSQAPFIAIIILIILSLIFIIRPKFNNSLLLGEFDEKR